VCKNIVCELGLTVNSIKRRFHSSLSRRTPRTTSTSTCVTTPTRCQFHQHFTHASFVWKQISELFSHYFLALWLFVKRILSKKAHVKFWWNWLSMDLSGCPTSLPFATVLSASDNRSLIAEYIVSDMLTGYVILNNFCNVNISF